MSYRPSLCNKKARKRRCFISPSQSFVPLDDAIGVFLLLLPHALNPALERTGRRAYLAEVGRSCVISTARAGNAWILRRSIRPCALVVPRSKVARGKPARRRLFQNLLQCLLVVLDGEKVVSASVNHGLCNGLLLKTALPAPLRSRKTSRATSVSASEISRPRRVVPHVKEPSARPAKG
jgi:hypothetical protein